MITTEIVKSTFNGISESQILLSETDLCIDRDSIPGVLGGIGVGVGYHGQRPPCLIIFLKV